MKNKRSGKPLNLDSTETAVALVLHFEGVGMGNRGLKKAILFFFVWAQISPVLAASSTNSTPYCPPGSTQDTNSVLNYAATQATVSSTDADVQKFTKTLYEAHKQLAAEKISQDEFLKTTGGLDQASAASILFILSHYEKWGDSSVDFKSIREVSSTIDPDLVKLIDSSPNTSLRKVLYNNFVSKLQNKSTSNEEKEKLTTTLVEVIQVLSMPATGLFSDKGLLVPGVANIFEEAEAEAFLKSVEGSYSLADATKWSNLWIVILQKVQAANNPNLDLLKIIKEKIILGLGGDPLKLSDPKTLSAFLAKKSFKDVLNALESQIPELEKSFAMQSAPLAGSPALETPVATLNQPAEFPHVKILLDRIQPMKNGPLASQDKIQRLWALFKSFFKSDSNELAASVLAELDIDWQTFYQKNKDGNLEMKSAAEIESAELSLGKALAKIPDDKILRTLQSLFLGNFKLHSTRLKEGGFVLDEKQEDAFYQATFTAQLRSQFAHQFGVQGMGEALNWRTLRDVFASEVELANRDNRGYAIGGLLVDSSGKALLKAPYFKVVTRASHNIRDQNGRLISHINPSEMSVLFDPYKSKIPLPGSEDESQKFEFKLDPNFNPLKGNQIHSYEASEPTDAYVHGLKEQKNRFTKEERQRFALAEQIAKFAPKEGASADITDPLLRVSGGLSEGHRYLLTKWGSDTDEALTLFKYLSNYGAGMVDVSLDIAKLREIADEVRDFENEIKTFFKHPPKFTFKNYEDFRKNSEKFIVAANRTSVLAPGIPFEALGMNADKKYLIDFSSLPLRDGRLISNPGKADLKPIQNLSFRSDDPNWLTWLGALENAVFKRKLDITKRIRAMENAPQIKDLNSWTVTELEALLNLVRIYGWDSSTFPNPAASNPMLNPTGGKSAEAQKPWLTLREKLQNFDATNLADMRSLLVTSQIASVRLPAFSALYGMDWKEKVEIVFEDKVKIPPVSLLLSQWPEIKKVQAALLKAADENVLYYAIDRSSGAIAAPRLKVVADRRAELVKVLRAANVLSAEKTIEEEDATVAKAYRVFASDLNELLANRYGVEVESSVSANQDDLSKPTTPEVLKQFVRRKSLAIDNKLITNMPTDPTKPEAKLEDQPVVEMELYKKYGFPEEIDRTKNPDVQHTDPKRQSSKLDVREKSFILRSSARAHEASSSAIRSRMLSEEAFFLHAFDDPADSKAGAYFDDWFTKRIRRDYSSSHIESLDLGAPSMEVPYAPKGVSPLGGITVLLGTHGYAGLDFVGLSKRPSFLKTLEKEEFEVSVKFFSDNSKKFFEAGESLFANMGKDGRLNREELKKIMNRVLSDEKYAQTLKRNSGDAFSWDVVSDFEAEEILGQRWRDANDGQKKILLEQITQLKRFMISGDAMMNPVTGHGARLADVAGLELLRDMFDRDPTALTNGSATLKAALGDKPKEGLRILFSEDSGPADPETGKNPKQEAKLEYMNAALANFGPLAFAEQSQLVRPMTYVDIISPKSPTDTKEVASAALQTYGQGHDRFSRFFLGSTKTGLLKGSYNDGRNTLVLKEIFGAKFNDVLASLDAESRSQIETTAQDLAQISDEIEALFVKGSGFSRSDLSKIYSSEVKKYVNKESTPLTTEDNFSVDTILKSYALSVKSKETAALQLELLKKMHVKSAYLIIQNLGNFLDPENGKPVTYGFSHQARIERAANRFAEELKGFTRTSINYGLSTQSLTDGIQHAFDSKELREMHKAYIDRIYKAENPKMWVVKQVAMGPVTMLQHAALGIAQPVYRVGEIFIGDSAIAIDWVSGKVMKPFGKDGLKTSDAAFDAFNDVNLWNMSGFSHQLLRQGNGGALAASWGMDAFTGLTFGTGAIVKGTMGRSVVNQLIKKEAQEAAGAAGLLTMGEAKRSVRSVVEEKLVSALKPVTGSARMQNSLKSVREAAILKEQKIDILATTTTGVEMTAKAMKSQAPLGKRSAALRLLDSTKKNVLPIAKGIGIQTAVFSAGQLGINAVYAGKLPGGDQPKSSLESSVDNWTVVLNNLVFFAAMAAAHRQLSPALNKVPGAGKWLSKGLENALGPMIFHYMKREAIRSAIEWGNNTIPAPWYSGEKGFHLAEQPLGGNLDLSGKPKSDAEIGMDFWNNVFLFSYVGAGHFLPKYRFYQESTALQTIFPSHRRDVKDFSQVKAHFRNLVIAGVKPADILKMAEAAVDNSKGRSPLARNLDKLKLTFASKAEVERLEAKYLETVREAVAEAVEGLKTLSQSQKDMLDLLESFAKIDGDLTLDAAKKHSKKIDLMNQANANLLFFSEASSELRDMVTGAFKARDAGGHIGVPLSKELKPEVWEQFLKEVKDLGNAIKVISPKRGPLGEQFIEYKSFSFIKDGEGFANGIEYYSSPVSGVQTAGVIDLPRHGLKLHYKIPTEIEVRRDGGIQITSPTGDYLKVEVDSGGQFARGRLMQNGHVQEFLKLEEMGAAFKLLNVEAFNLASGTAKPFENKNNLAVSQVVSKGAYKYKDAEGKERDGDIIYRTLGPNNMIRETFYAGNGSRILEFKRTSNGKSVEIPIKKLEGGRFYSVDLETGNIVIGNRHNFYLKIDTKGEFATEYQAYYKEVTDAAGNKSIIIAEEPMLTKQAEYKYFERADALMKQGLKEEDLKLKLEEVRQDLLKVPLDEYIKASRDLADYAPYALYNDFDLGVRVNHLFQAAKAKDVDANLSKLGLDKNEDWNRIKSADEKMTFLKKHYSETLMRSKDAEAFKRDLQPIYNQLGDSLRADAYLERLKIDRTDLAGMSAEQRFAEIKKRYRKLQTQYHPDMARENATLTKEYEETSKLLSEAYEYFEKNQHWQ